MIPRQSVPEPEVGDAGDLLHKIGERIMPAVRDLDGLELLD